LLGYLLELVVGLLHFVIIARGNTVLFHNHIETVLEIPAVGILEQYRA
jgi:hypothetical protein